jgi:hypothetical protein
MAPSSSVTTSSAPASMRRLHQRVLRGAGLEQQLPAMLEHERDRTVGAKVAAVLGEGMTHLGDRARAVVGQGVDDDRRAADAVALVADLVVSRCPRRRPCPLVIALLTVSLGMLASEALSIARRSRGLAPAITAAELGGDGDLLDDPGEQLAALLVLATLAVLDVGPFGMAGHVSCVPSWMPDVVGTRGGAWQHSPPPGRGTDPRVSDDERSYHPCPRRPAPCPCLPGVSLVPAESRCRTDADRHHRRHRVAPAAGAWPTAMA